MCELRSGLLDSSYKIRPNTAVAVKRITNKRNNPGNRCLLLDVSFLATPQTERNAFSFNALCSLVHIVERKILLSFYANNCVKIVE